MDIQPISPISSPTLFDKSNPNIQVLVRVRPLNSKEIQEGARSCLFLDSQDPSKITLDTKPEQKVFYFDFVAGKVVSQVGLFDIVGRPLAEICIEGYNICIFAYGQTGAGKTHTMQGRFDKNEEWGLQPKVFEYLFDLIAREKESEFCLKVTYLEIYNEQINDLLKSGNCGLQIREDVKKGPYVEGLSEEKAENAVQMMEIMKKGMKNRHIGSTYMNIESSRSHSIFTITVESQKKVNNVINQRVSKLNFVDLAGSERQKQSGTSGSRLKEAGNINKSLTILGCVINSLVESNQRKSKHIPYRDSKLTFILRDSLGGNSKTCMIAAISSASSSFCETLSTLKFAQRAKMIRNKACVNEEMTGNVEVLKLEIKRLKEELLKSQEIVGNWKLIYEINEKELEKERFFWVLVKKSGEILSDLSEKKGKCEFMGEIKDKLSENGMLMREIESFLQKILRERSEIKIFLEKNQTPSPRNTQIVLEKSQVFDDFPPDLDAFLKPFFTFSVSESEKLRFEALQSDFLRLQEEFEILQASYFYEKEDSRRKSDSLRVFEKKSLEEHQTEQTNKCLQEENSKFLEKIENLTQIIEEKDMDLALLKANDSDLRGVLIEFEIEKVALIEEKKKLEDGFNKEMLELGEDKEMMEEKIEALMIENELIRGEKHEVLSEMEEIKAENSILHGEKVILEEKNNDLMKEKEGIYKEKEELERLFNEKTRGFEELERTNRKCLTEMDDLKKSMEKTKNELNEKTRKYEDLTSENLTLQGNMEKTQNELNEKTRKNEDLTNENLALQGKIEAENLKMNEFLVTIKDKLRVRDQKIELLKKENDQKEEELLKTAMNLQEILKGSEESFKELKNLKEIKQENQRLEKNLEDLKNEKERLEDLYKKLEYQANIMKANYKIKENEGRKLQEEKKLADLMSAKFEKQTKMLEEKLRGIENLGKNSEFEVNEKNFDFGLKKENKELKNEIVRQKEIIETHRRKVEDFARKALLDPKKTLIQMDENIKLKSEMRELKEEKMEIYRLMAKMNKLCSEENSDFLDLEESYEPAKLVNSLSAWITSLKERENRIFEKENHYELQETRLRVIKEEYNLFVKKIALKKTEFSPHRLEKFLEDYDRKNDERRKTEMWAKSEKIHKKTLEFDEEEYLSLPKKKIKMV